MLLKSISPVHRARRDSLMNAHPESAFVIASNLELIRNFDVPPGLDEEGRFIKFSSSMRDQQVLALRPDADLQTPLERRLDTGTQPVAGLALVAGGVLAAASADGSIRGFQVAGGQPTFTVSHGAAITSLVASAGGDLFASGGKGGSARIWKPDGSAVGPGVTGLAGDVAALAVSADGRRLAVGLAAPPPGGAGLTLHDATSGQIGRAHV